MVEVIRLGEGVDASLEEVIRLEVGTNAGLVGLRGLRTVDTGLLEGDAGLLGGDAGLLGGVAGLLGGDTGLLVINTGFVGVEGLRGVNIVLGGGLDCFDAESGSGLGVEVVVCVSFECNAP